MSITLAASRFIDVYAGEGSWRPSVDSALEIAREYGGGLRVREVRELRDLNPSTTACLVIPGGYSPSIIWNNISANIDQYVQNGGKFLGICAGAVIATDLLIGKPTKVSEQASNYVKELFKQGALCSATRDMKGVCNFSVYPGSCVAPHIIKNPLAAEDVSNFCAVDIETSMGLCQFPFYSGPAFLEIPPETEVLATFKEPIQLKRAILNDKVWELTEESVEKENPPAVLFYRKGLGKIVLSAIHPEFNPETFSGHAERAGFLKDLPVGAEQEESRRRLLVEIFEKLNS